MTIYLQNRDMIAAHNARRIRSYADLQTPRVLRGNSIVHDSRQLQSPIQCRLAQPGTRHRC